MLVIGFGVSPTLDAAAPVVGIGFVDCGLVDVVAVLIGCGVSYVENGFVAAPVLGFVEDCFVALPVLCIDLVLWIVEPLLLELVPLFISLGVSPVGEGVVGVAKLDNDCVGSFFKVLFEDVLVLVPIGLGVSLFDSLVISSMFEVAAVDLDTTNEVVLSPIGTGVSKTGGFVVISRGDGEVSCEVAPLGIGFGVSSFRVGANVDL